MSKGMTIEGIAASEAIDSSGEVILLKGLDISDFLEGKALLNYEHKSGAESGGTALDIIGKIIYAKKIYSEKDCENANQLAFYKSIELPLLYIQARLFDAAGHPAAMAAAAAIRDNVANGEPLSFGFSIEGSTLERDHSNKKILTKCVARGCALTAKPCNKSAIAGLLSDPNAPAGFQTNPNTKDTDPLEEMLAMKHEHPGYRRLASGPSSLGIHIVEEPVSKTLTAGSYDVAPSALVGGAALQVEDRSSQIHRLAARAKRSLEKWDKKQPLKEYLKSDLSDVDPDFLDRFADMAEHLHLKKSLELSAEQLRWQLDSATIELRKALHFPSATEEQSSANDVYSVFTNEEHPEKGEYRRLVAQWQIDGGNFNTLCDYENLFDDLKDGPVTGQHIARMNELAEHPDFEIEFSVNPANGNLGSVPAELEDTTNKPTRFHYLHNDGSDPVVLELKGANVVFNGHQLSREELCRLVEHLNIGNSSLCYIKSESISKGEFVRLDPSLERALCKLRKAVSDGKITPDVAQRITREIFVDPMVPGIGNKKAYTDFASRVHNGVHVHVDANDFGDINKVHGHEAGDEAIKKLGLAWREAMDSAVGRTHGKVFRTGGDEGRMFVPSFELASRFVRCLQEKLDLVPKIGDTHRLSLSIGIGDSPQAAEAALMQAKHEKKSANYPRGQAKHHVFVMMPDSKKKPPEQKEVLPLSDPQEEQGTVDRPYADHIRAPTA